MIKVIIVPVYDCKPTEKKEQKTVKIFGITVYKSIVTKINR
jgi:hypothetical protein